MEATIVIAGETMTLEEAVTRATQGGNGRMTAEERAILGGTRRSTPMALMAEAAKARR